MRHPFYNDSDKSVPYKHEKRWANRRLECRPKETRSVDSVFHNGWDSPPHKVPNNCECSTSDGIHFDTVCSILAEFHKRFRPQIFDDYNKPRNENWDPAAPIQDSQDDEWCEAGSPMP